MSNGSGGKEIPPDPLLMGSLKTLLDTIVDKACDNICGSLLERFIKTRASKKIGHPVYLLDGPGPSTAISGPHQEFFNVALRIWICGKHFSCG